MKFIEEFFNTIYRNVTWFFAILCGMIGVDVLVHGASVVLASPVCLWIFCSFFVFTMFYTLVQIIGHTSFAIPALVYITAIKRTPMEHYIENPALWDSCKKVMSRMALTASGLVYYFIPRNLKNFC